MFSCSGAADLAEIGDRAVRAVHKAGAARMFCLAGISGKVESIEDNTRGAERLLVVDGCDSDCARKTMEFGGFTGFTHFRVSDLGLEKGKTPVTDERIQMVAARLRVLLADQPRRAGAMGGSGPAIQIAGPGCPNCQTTEKNVINACAELNLAARISHVTNIAEILDLGVMHTPAVVVDGRIVISGRVPSVEEIKAILASQETRELGR
jgi:small redox-active disulfide protein 2